ncbi:hypothetical protein CSC36_0001 [Pseudomonas aeruginosa]|nr:hypothetical protein CSC36_0001 [Pseudomonas aeruginosa]
MRSGAQEADRGAKSELNSLGAGSRLSSIGSLRGAARHWRLQVSPPR